MKGIPLYREIDDLHKLTGSSLRTKIDSFHCFDMSLTNDLKVTKLSPHRADFYTLALNFGTKKLNYTLNGNEFSNPSHFILCVAPGQVAHWEKNDDWFGYCSFFKSDFLHFISTINFLQQFPFFNINETNLFPIDEDNFEILSPHFKQIIKEQNELSKFSVEIIRASFQNILWQIRRIYEEINVVNPTTKANAIITSQFQHLVNEHFLSKISVDEYAQLLNITSNHLSQTVKEATGSAAKHFITKRRLEEAKYLLLYTKDSVADISFYLNFSEPTHFVKFFKKELGKTPLEFRFGD